MARYTNFFMTGSSSEEINQTLVTALEACDLNLIHQDPVCIVAKEKPGQVSFAQLATIEILINPPTIEAGGAKIDLVVKNEELPLRTNNHCREVFSLVNQAITDAHAENANRNGAAVEGDTQSIAS
ncbi:MAG: hypothetical protein AAGC93_26480 [Cyanobacteria bacterium P01_F01_bin.53]